MSDALITATDFMERKLSCTNSIAKLGKESSNIRRTYGRLMRRFRKRSAQVFTRASSNLYGPIGGYNLGLSWDSRNLVDEPDYIVTPLRYLALTNIYPGIADQPPQSTFDFTLRDRSGSKFRFNVGNQVAWVIGNQSGYAIVTEAGEVTIPRITFKSSTAHNNLTVIRTSSSVVGN